MYCIKCGVELADSEKVCPLCGTRVFHPDLPQAQGEPPYPPQAQARPEEVSHTGALFVLTVLLALPAVLSILCDWRVNGRIVWSGYSVGGAALLYVMVVLPLWFRRPNPVIFVPVDFAAIGLYLLYINFATGGHWFLTFAFPVTGAIGLLVSGTVALLHYLRRGQLFVIGGALILGGGVTVLIEYLLNVTFHVGRVFFWSVYPLSAGVVLGVTLLVVGFCKPLRRSLHRKFFLGFIEKGHSPFSMRGGLAALRASASFAGLRHSTPRRVYFATYMPPRNTGFHFIHGLRAANSVRLF